MMRRRPMHPELGPSPRQRQIIAGWVAHLAVDLVAAQAALRRPLAEMPVPPSVPPRGWSHGWWADEFAEDAGTLPRLTPTSAAAIAASSSPSPAAEPAEPAGPAAPSRPLRGAYARRARQSP